MGGKEPRSNRNFNKKAWMIALVPAYCTWCLPFLCIGLSTALFLLSAATEESSQSSSSSFVYVLLVCIPLGGLNDPPFYYPIFVTPASKNEQANDAFITFLC